MAPRPAARLRVPVLLGRRDHGGASSRLHLYLASCRNSRRILRYAMWTEPDMPEAWERWIRATGLHQFVADHVWWWPMSETLHYLGLSLLLGTVGLFDLRVLGMAKGVSPRAIHRLIPWGVAGYAVKVLT